MGIFDRLDRRTGQVPRADETRRSFLARMSQRRTYVPKAVYLELLALHDSVADLEARIANLESK